MTRKLTRAEASYRSSDGKTHWELHRGIKEGLQLHVLLKFQNIKGKEKILEASREKRRLSTKNQESFLSDRWYQHWQAVK